MSSDDWSASLCTGLSSASSESSADRRSEHRPSSEPILAICCTLNVTCALARMECGCALHDRRAVSTAGWCRGKVGARLFAMSNGRECSAQDGWMDGGWCAAHSGWRRQTGGESSGRVVESSRVESSGDWMRKCAVCAVRTGPTLTATVPFRIEVQTTAVLSVVLAATAERAPSSQHWHSPTTSRRGGRRKQGKCGGARESG